MNTSGLRFPVSASCFLKFRFLEPHSGVRRGFLAACLFVCAWPVLAEEPVTPPAKQASDYTVSASTTAAWGVNLGTGSSGFTNSATFKLIFPIIKPRKESLSGKSLYGDIEISNIDLSLTTDGRKGYIDLSGITVTSRIVAGKFNLGLYSRPGFTMENAPFIEPYSVTDYEEESYVAPTIPAVGGISLGYAFSEQANLEIRLGSLGNWGLTDEDTPPRIPYIATGKEDTTDDALDGILYWEADGVTPAPAKLVKGKLYLREDVSVIGKASDKYSFGVHAKLRPFPFLFLALGAQTRNDTDAIGLTGRIALDPAPRLSFYAGADAERIGPVWRADYKANAAWIFDEGDEDDDRTGSLVLEAYCADPSAINRPALGELDLALRLISEVGMKGGLGGEIGVFADDVLYSHDPLPLTFLERLLYKFMLRDENYIEPYEAVGYSLDDPSEDPSNIYLDTGVEFQLFPNTVFLLNYEVGSILNDGKGSKFLEGGKLDKGTLKIEVTIGF